MGEGSWIQEEGWIQDLGGTPLSAFLRVPPPLPCSLSPPPSPFPSPLRPLSDPAPSVLCIAPSVLCIAPNCLG